MTVTISTAIRAAASPAAAAGSRSRTGEESSGGGLSDGSEPPGTPPLGAAPEAAASLACAGADALGSLASPEVPGDGSPDADSAGLALARGAFVGFGVTAGTTAVVSFAQRYSRVVRPD